MSTTRRLGCLLAAYVSAAFLAVLAAPSSAEESDLSEAAAPSVEELVAEALRRAPSLAALEARLDAATQVVAPAGALPNPTVEVMVQDAGFPSWTVGEEEMSMIGPQISQGIPFPGKQGARRSVAEAEVHVREGDLERLRRQVVEEVRDTYAVLYALDHEHRILGGGKDLADLLSATVAHHQMTAESDQEAAFKARLVLSRIEERLEDLHAERSMAVARLNRLLDRSGNAALGRVDSLASPVAPVLPWDSLAVAVSAEVTTARASVEAARRRVRVAELDLRPDLMLGAGVGFRGDRDPVVSFRLGVELPIWQFGKERPLIRAAKAEYAASLADLREAEAGARSEADALRADWERVLRQVVRYQQSFVPQSSLAFDAARAAYLGDRGDFSTVIEDLNIWLEARTGLARWESERFRAWARLETLLTPAFPASDEASQGETR